jgi:dTDP-4-dehydrorhamnose 3,5-epimerase-like enzyme
VERGFAYDDPEVGIEWPALELQVSERDATAPRLSDIAAELPFTA